MLDKNGTKNKANEIMINTLRVTLISLLPSPIISFASGEENRITMIMVVKPKATINLLDNRLINKTVL